MSIPEQIEKIELPNGLTLKIWDHSRHYFGGFHYVRISVTCDIKVAEEHLLDPDLLLQATGVLGPVATFRKDLERMGVHPDELGSVRRELIDSFLRHSFSYLSDDDFPGRFLQSRLKQERTRKKTMVVADEW